MAKEIISKRTYSSKTYDLGNGKRLLKVWGGDVHYKDDYTDASEQWKDIDLTWQGNKISKAPYELTLEGNKITFRDKKTGKISFIELLEIGSKSISEQTWEYSKGIATIKNMALDTDLEIVATDTGIRFTRVLKSDKAPLEAKYKITGTIPFRVSARDEEDELKVESEIIDGVLTEKLGKVDRVIKYPVRIDPDFTGSTADGYVAGGSTIYATARSTATTYSTGGTTFTCGQVFFSPNYINYRGFLKFDTSGIGPGQNILQDNLNMTVQQDNSAADFDVQIVKQDWSAQDPIETATREAAYDNCLAGTEDDSIWRNTDGIAVNTNYTSGNLDVTWVEPEGNTYYSLRSSRDLNADEPTAKEYIVLYSQENATAAYRPYLTILYEAAAPPSPNFTNRNNYNGYLAFIQQYMKHKVNETTPWKNPDGTLID